MIGAWGGTERGREGEGEVREREREREHLTCFDAT